MENNFKFLKKYYFILSLDRSIIAWLCEPRTWYKSIILRYIWKSDAIVTRVIPLSMPLNKVVVSGRKLAAKGLSWFRLYQISIFAGNSLVILRPNCSCRILPRSLLTGTGRSRRCLSFCLIGARCIAVDYVLTAVELFQRNEPHVGNVVDAHLTTH